MSQSLSNIVVHLVFSTKGRRQLIRDEERGDLHAYITGILKNVDSPLIEINSVRDHIHILFAQSKNHAPAKIVEQVKSSSSCWIKEQHSSYIDFAWQAGYGEFSVSPMHIEAVREYIRNQPEHQGCQQRTDEAPGHRKGPPVDLHPDHFREVERAVGFPAHQRSDEADKD
jgi:REP element-mobilizing transposase RayT